MLFVCAWLVSQRVKNYERGGPDDRRTNKGNFHRRMKDFRAGVWMQITSGSLAGAFGRNAQYWAHRMLDEGCVHLLATDAHDTQRRPPDLRRGRDLAAARVGIEEAEHLVVTRPRGVVENEIPANLPMPVALTGSARLRGGYLEADLPDTDIETKGSAERANGFPGRHTYVRGLADRLRHLVGSSR